LEYTQPLILYSFVGFLVAFLDRWLLQFIGGSVEQGFYGISLKLGTLAYLFTNAMTPVLTREFAFAHEKNDFERLRNLFKKIQFFLFLASITGIFISIQSYNIIEVIGGEKYKDAILPIAIMAFSPIHQTFGQLSSSLYLASGNTRLYSKIGIYLMLMGMPVTYICLAPKNFFIPGLELQATGLAIKMVLVQFLATNIMLYFNCKFLKISFLQWIWIQLRVILSVLVIALLAKVAVDLFLVKNQFLENFLKIFFEENTKIFHYAINIRIFSALAQIMAGGMFFMALIILLLKAYPRISGLSKDELREYLLLFRNKLSLKRSV
jgi:O-antigen/teichoic acid export membrane protein